MTFRSVCPKFGVSCGEIEPESLLETVLSIIESLLETVLSIVKLTKSYIGFFLNLSVYWYIGKVLELLHIAEFESMWG